MLFITIGRFIRIGHSSDNYSIEVGIPHIGFARISEASNFILPVLL